MKHKRQTLLIAAAVLILTSCGQDENKIALQAPAATKVTVITLEPADISVTSSWPARIAAYRIAQIRPQVSGIVTARLFYQGTEVKAGQPLFQIDPALLEADVQAAEAALAKAEASHHKSSLHAHRLSQLQSSGAVSRKDYDNVLATRAQTAAEVAEARALLNKKKLALAYSTVRAPISGRIDQAFVTEGALVRQEDSQAMAIVQQTEKVYVDVRLPAAERRPLFARSGAENDPQKSIEITLLDEDGKPYDVSVNLLFSGISVDHATGDVILRALAENPDGILMPGMYVRVRITRHIQHNGLLIPAQAIQRTGEENVVWTVDHSGKVRKTAVILAGENSQGEEIVRSGLNSGETLVVEGQNMLQDGMQVTPVPLKPQK